jgi:protoporphyrinogen/coproporphyrinogen III oxidase
VKIAVIGGGVAGLAAAWELRHNSDVTLFEPVHLGGCIKTTSFLDRPVDEGPDAFITRIPDALELCREVGIESELIAPAAGRAAIWWNGRLRTLPDGLVLGVPSRPMSLLRTGILSPAGAARATLDIVLPRVSVPPSATVRQIVAARFGDEVADRLVDPLIGSVYAGSTRELGAAETVPQLADVAKSSRSVSLGLRRLRTIAGGPPLFLTPRGGMQRLVHALVEGMSSVQFVAHRVTAIRPVPGGGWLLEPCVQHYDAVVVATSAPEAARMLATEGVKTLDSMPTASVVLLTAALKGVDLPPQLNGFLVPRNSGRLMTACSFGSNKWPHWGGPATAVVRISAGRYGESKVLELDDAMLVDRLLDELRDALGVDFSCVATRISRYPHSFPQYFPEHGSLVSKVEAFLETSSPGVYLAGSSYRGIGVPACISSGRRAARLARESVMART